MSTTTLTKEQVAERITNRYHVGWRKGVDGEGSARIWSALHNACFNDSRAIQALYEQHVERVSEAGAECHLSGGSREAVAKAMREAAIQPLTISGGEPSIQANNQGVECVKSLFPIEFETFGRKWKLDIDEDGDCRRFVKDEGDADWRSWEYLHKDKLELPAIVLLALVERIPAVREHFAAQLSENAEAKVAREIEEASKAVTEDGWQGIAHWCLE